MASTSRWQRSTASIRLRAAATSAVTTCMSTPKRRPSMPRGSRMPLRVVERIADRQRMQHGAAVAHRMAAAGRQHAGDVAVGDGAAGDVDVGGEAARCRAARRTATRTTDSSCTPAHALGDVDGLADHLLGLGEIDHARRPSCRARRCGRSRAPRRRGCGGAARPAAPAARAARSGRRSCWCRCRARRRSRSAAATPASSSGVRP